MPSPAVFATPVGVCFARGGASVVCLDAVSKAEPVSQPIPNASPGGSLPRDSSCRPAHRGGRYGRRVAPGVCSLVGRSFAFQSRLHRLSRGPPWEYSPPRLNQAQTPPYTPRSPPPDPLPHRLCMDGRRPMFFGEENVPDRWRADCLPARQMQRCCPATGPEWVGLRHG